MGRKDDGAGLRGFWRKSAEMPQARAGNRPLGAYDGTGLLGFSRPAPWKSLTDSIFPHYGQSRGMLWLPLVPGPEEYTRASMRCGWKTFVCFMLCIGVAPQVGMWFVDKNVYNFVWD